jgi:hypothetical protein
VSDSPVSHFSDLRLQKPVSIESDAPSHDPSPSVHVPSKQKVPNRPDSVPNQYVFFWSGQVYGVTVLSIVLLRYQQCGLYVLLCFSRCVRGGFHPTFYYFLAFCGFDVSSSPPSLNFMTPDVRCSVFIEGKYLVKSFFPQVMCPDVVFRFPYYPLAIVTEDF